jgi:hypothetical protein
MKNIRKYDVALIYMCVHVCVYVYNKIPNMTYT